MYVKMLYMVTVCGEAMVNALELNAMHVCEEAMDGECYVKKLYIGNVYYGLWRSYGECA